MANGVSQRVLNDLFNTKLKTSTKRTKVKQFGGAYIRDRLLEVSFARTILPPPVPTGKFKLNPDRALRDLRKLCGELEHAFYQLDVALEEELPERPPLDEEQTIQLVELVQKLDYWLKKGGRLPRSWKHGR